MRIRLAGFRHGWTQPSTRLTSTSVGDDGERMELLDRWINRGQFARLGLRSEAWIRNFPIFRAHKER